MTRILAAILSVSLLTASVILPGFASLGSSSMAVEITHSHVHGDEEHTHDALGFQTADHTNPDSQDARHDENGTSHSHTILVAGPAAVALPQNIEFSYVTNTASIQKHVEEFDPPLDRSLGSIFRPPIQA